MARKRRRHHRRTRRVSRRRRNVRMSNPTVFPLRRRRRHHHRRRRSNGRRRSNPSIRELTSGNMLSLVGGGAAGFFGARMIPQNLPMLSQYNTGFVGYALNALSGLGVSMLLGKFVSRSARTGALVGTGVAVVARFVTDRFSGSSMSGLGDMDYDLSYYTSERFPFPQGVAGGPYQQFPGNPYGAAPMLPTAASAVNAGAAAARAALPAGGAGQGGDSRYPANGNW